MIGATGPRTFPILLAHGICRFEVLLRPFVERPGVAADALHYFRSIRSTLEGARFIVRHASVPWARPVRVRAAELKRNVEQVLAETRAERIHIVAHSVGGLDARRMLYDFRSSRIHDRIASISTIGTPHHGTSFADWGIKTLGSLLSPLLERLGIEYLDGFQDLTQTACAAFNAQAEDFERTCDVLFQTFGGTQELDNVFEPLRLSWNVISEREGPNDGLVSLRSALWRPELAVAPDLSADHLNQLGWWEPSDMWPRLDRTRPKRYETPRQIEQRIRGFYVEMAAGLAERFPV